MIKKAIIFSILTSFAAFAHAGQTSADVSSSPKKGDTMSSVSMAKDRPLTGQYSARSVGPKQKMIASVDKPSMPKKSRSLSGQYSSLL